MKKSYLLSVLFSLIVSCAGIQATEKPNPIVPTVLCTQKDTLYQITLLDDQQVIGFAKCSKLDDNNEFYFELLQLHVNKQYRQYGYGSLILEITKNYLKHCGAHKIVFWVCPFELREGEQQAMMFPKLIQFYKAHGGTYSHTDTTDPKIQKMYMVITLKEKSILDKIRTILPV